MNKKLSTVFISLILVMSTSFGGFCQEMIRLKVNEFDSASAYVNKDSTWSIMEVKSDHLTDYSLITDRGGTKAIRAVSNNAAGGLIYKIGIDPKEYPIIEWRWKIEGVLGKGDMSKKKGDDYPARIYIIFDYDRANLSFFDRIKLMAMRTFTSHNIPLRSLDYVWANKAKTGTIAPSAFTDWVYMVAVQSGNEHAGRWMTETQNIREDYRAAFGEDPPAITGVAIMTDTDNTGESATAYYGDIVFKKRSGTKSAK